MYPEKKERNDKIVEDYQSGRTIPELAKLHEISTTQVRNILENRKVQRRPKGTLSKWGKHENAD